MANYIALIRKDRQSDYSVDFPDFPGCVTAGRTLDQAREMAVEALGFHIDGMLDDGAGLPAPRPMDAIMSDRRNSSAVAFLVTVPDRPDRAIRVNITISESMLRRIDTRARQDGLSRSAFIAEAAACILGIGKRAGRKTGSGHVRRPARPGRSSTSAAR